MKRKEWHIVITPKSSLFDLNLKEVWRYRDLLMLFVKRDVITLYKQTILGPLWYLIQPLFTSVIFTVIFSDLAGIGTGGVPPFLFMMAGVTTWNYFKECLTATSDTFKKNEAIFGKVYFPRMIMPMSIVISNLLKFGIQFLIFIGFYIYYYLTGAELYINSLLFLYPFIIITMGLFGLGIGMIVSSLVTKYRDLTFLISFGVQLLMYVSAVMYPLSEVSSSGKMKSISWLIEYNPLSIMIEASRLLLLDSGTVSSFQLIVTFSTTIFILLFGILIFNKTEKTFIDTI